MPLPANFNHWKHLLSVLVSLQNKIVTKHFTDIDPTIASDNIATKQASLYTACTMTTHDTVNIVIARLLLFYIILRKAQDLQAPIYGIPIENYHDSVEFKPQIKLIFHEKKADAIAADRIPIRAQIGFRLMGKTSTTITEDEIKALATKIKSVFVGTTVYSFARGERKVSYRDPTNGYHMILAVPSIEVGEEVVKKVLSIQNHTFNPDYFTISASSKNYAAITGTNQIAGKQYRKPKQRPTGTVRFRRAELSLHGMYKDILLVCDGDYLDSKPYEYFWSTP